MSEQWNDQPTTFNEQKKQDAHDPLQWLQAHKQDIMVGAIVILSIKNRRLRRDNIRLVLRSRELISENKTLLNIIKGNSFIAQNGPALMDKIFGAKSA